jgi:hypothetical protein
MLPRPPSTREREILDFLLSVDFAGAPELRAQAATASVTAMCPCGCASFDTDVDRTLTPAGVESVVPVHAWSNEGAFELLLFARDGWLAGVEIVYYDEESPKTFPPPDTFDQPKPDTEIR